ncbi:hypothetical protein [Sphingomonas sp.]|uniref:hypothetical protein n=1 Tax=Sphingomonas sp. TaxID=28214 RepID=UPI0025F82117|nr:hypothetical protein [Sphingomonas sp.]
MAQAVSSAPPEKIDLTIPQPCEARRSSNDEIIVCAPGQKGLSPYRIHQPAAEQPVIPKAQLQLAEGVSVAAETEQAVINGFPSNRLMVGLKIKF